MERQYIDYYKSITGFSPYQYQVKVAELLLSGKNVILAVPTGTGKTWASVIPFLFAKQDPFIDFPQKLIYSLPLRTLANSIHGDVEKALKQHQELNNISSIHTGEYKNDEHFKSDIIFSTIDQTLSSFLCFPLSLSKRQANINAGALVGSYLVFDEFHLLEPKLSMATTLGSLKALGILCQFCIMTATLSNKYIVELKKAVNAEVVSIDDFPEDVAKIGSLKVPAGIDSKKSLTVVNATISAESILEQHKCKTIIICNRVEKAQRIYHDVLNSLAKELEKSNVICLHSRFFDKSRKSKEENLKRLFGKGNKESAILISTQVIEAGMDISCDKMHVEVSPINSFLQRAGRCARWENEVGDIYVYDILDLEDREMLELETDVPQENVQIRAINNKYLPYDKELCESTLKQLKQTVHLDKDTAQLLVDQILTGKELNDYSRIMEGDYNRCKIQKSWETCEKNMYSETIRDIQSIEIAIIDYEKEKNKGKDFHPYRYETIGLFKWSFIKWAKEILEGKDFDMDDDVFFTALENSQNPIIDFDTNDQDGYTLKPVRDLAVLKNYYDTVFVDRSIFKYTAEAGLELGAGNICSPVKVFEKNDKETIVYKKDTFEQHNKALIACYEQEFRPQLSFTFKRLNEYWNDSIDWDKLIKAMICLHDYGKLNSAWQKPMKRLQELKNNGNYNPDEVLAHTDFDETTDKDIEAQSGAKNKPAHAGIGAYVFYDKFSDIVNIEGLSSAFSTAILKHHGVDTERYPDFDILIKDYSHFESLFKEIGLNVGLKLKGREGKMADALPTNREEWITYLFLVRILRLSDQLATMNIEKYLNK